MAYKTKYFPKNICCNGWILVDGKKMAKSEGNFITINQLYQNVSTDSVRLTLADSGDNMDDANFVFDSAKNSNLLKLFNLIKTYETYESSVDGQEFYSKCPSLSIHAYFPASAKITTASTSTQCP